MSRLLEQIYYMAEKKIYTRLVAIKLNKGKTAAQIANDLEISIKEAEELIEEHRRNDEE